MSGEVCSLLLPQVNSLSQLLFNKTRYRRHVKFNEAFTSLITSKTYKFYQSIILVKKSFEEIENLILVDPIIKCREYIFLTWTFPSLDINVIFITRENTGVIGLRGITSWFVRDDRWLGSFSNSEYEKLTLKSIRRKKPCLLFIFVFVNYLNRIFN